jgi:hypothetical protein
MTTITSSSAPPSTSKKPAIDFRLWKEKAEDYIREKPARAAVQAALFGYTMQFIPLRTALAAVSRLAIPAVFAVGLYQVIESFRAPPPSKR